MDTVTRTFPITLTNSYTPDSIIELSHFRDMVFDSDERVAVYLESFFCNLSLKSFNLGVIPNFDGDESEIEKMAKFNAAEAKSQKFGLRILTRKNNTGDWQEKAEIILVNRGRKDYFDLLQPYLAKNQVRIFEKNDALAIQLIDYGNGLLKPTDYLGLEAAFTITIAKKNSLEAFEARLASLELAIKDRVSNIPPNSLLGRNTGTGVVEVISQLKFATPAMIDQAIMDLAGGAPGALNTLVELASALNNDANFASNIINQLSVINNAISNINNIKVVNISTPLNITANTWFTAGIFNSVGFASTEALYAITVYIQYSDGTNTYGHWQYSGGGVISSIQWKAGGTQLATTFKMEAHSGNDFTCSARFDINNINRNIQVMFDIPIVLQSFSKFRVSLKRLI